MWNPIISSLKPVQSVAKLPKQKYSFMTLFQVFIYWTNFSQKFFFRIRWWQISIYFFNELLCKIRWIPTSLKNFPANERAWTYGWCGILHDINKFILQRKKFNKMLGVIWWSKNGWTRSRWAFNWIDDRNLCPCFILNCFFDIKSILLDPWCWKSFGIIWTNKRWIKGNKLAF